MMDSNKRYVWIIWFGSLYDDDPWEIHKIFDSEEKADNFMLERKRHYEDSLYHKRKYEIF